MKHLFGGAQSGLASIALDEIDKGVHLIDQAIMEAKEHGCSVLHWTLCPFGLPLPRPIRRRFHILGRGGGQIANRRSADG
jgi:hypothetical protein